MTSALTRLKVMTIGDINVGKTSIIKRYCEDKFISKSNPTIGVDFGVKSVFVDGYENELRVNFFDLSGDNRFSSVRDEIVRNNSFDAIIMVYDITCKESFDHLRTWYSWLDSKLQNVKPPKFLIIGNKLDKKQERQVTQLDVRNLELEIPGKYVEVDANKGENLITALEELFQGIVMTS